MRNDRMEKGGGISGKEKEYYLEKKKGREKDMPP